MLDDPGARRFEVRTTRTGGVVVLSVSGDVDAVAAPQLTEEIIAELASHPTALVVDLSNVDFLAASGMTALLRGKQIGGGTRFVVVADGPITARPMRVLGVDLLLDIYPTLTAVPG